MDDSKILRHVSRTESMIDIGKSQCTIHVIIIYEYQKQNKLGKWPIVIINMFIMNHESIFFLSRLVLPQW